MSKPEIATILEDGTYGQREMTDAEYADYLAVQTDIPERQPLGDPE